MAGHGGRRKGSGRKPGIPNKVPRRPNETGLRASARAYTPNAIVELAKLGGLVRGTKGAVNELARVYALKTILNRGYGEPGKSVDLVVSPGIGPNLTDAELEQIVREGAATRTN